MDSPGVKRSRQEYSAVSPARGSHSVGDLAAASGGRTPSNRHRAFRPKSRSGCALRGPIPRVRTSGFPDGRRRRVR